MPDSVKISVLVSTYASEAFMAECLDDLVGQSAADRLEIVVVDANSPQNEGEIVARYKERFPRITYIRTPERIGIYAAWNVAIRAARGEYLISFSTNDRLAPDACEVLSRHLDEHPEVDLVYGDTHLTDLPHQTLDSFSPSQGPDGPAMRWGPFFYPELVGRCLVGPHPIWRKRIHDLDGFFDESFAALGDQEFWLRIGRKRMLRHIERFTGLYWVDMENALSRTERANQEQNELRLRFLPGMLQGDMPPEQREIAAMVQANLESGRVDEGAAIYTALLVPWIRLQQFKRFAGRLVSLMERGKIDACLRVWRMERDQYSDMPELQALDDLLVRIR